MDEGKCSPRLDFGVMNQQMWLLSHLPKSHYLPFFFMVFSILNVEMIQNPYALLFLFESVHIMLMLITKGHKKSNFDYLTYLKSWFRT